jgi:hypothetical protein
MPIKRDTIGRKYTERQILRQVGEPTEEDRQLAQAAWDRQREAALSPHHNFNAVVAWATAQLEESGLPSGRYELMGPPYNAEEWESKENRYRSLEWYAHKVLLSTLAARAWHKRGEHERAMDECIALGYLYREARQIAGTVEKQSAGGAAAKFSEKRQAAREEKARWREQAPLWWSKYPLWSATDVARRIAPHHLQSCRKAIANLKPK